MSLRIQTSTKLQTGKVKLTETNCGRVSQTSPFCLSALDFNQSALGISVN